MKNITLENVIVNEVVWHYGEQGLSVMILADSLVTDYGVYNLSYLSSFDLNTVIVSLYYFLDDLYSHAFYGEQKPQEVSVIEADADEYEEVLDMMGL